MISTNQFSINSTSKSFTADMSSLSRSASVFERVYSDACDQGFQLFNPKTGQSTWWVVDNEERDIDGDIMLWKLIPMAGSTVRFPALKGWTITIYND